MRAAGQRLQSRGHARRLAAMSPGTLRRAAGITQQTIADALGVSRMAVSTWETGARRPSGEAGAAYCRFIAGLARHAEVTW